MTDRDLLIALTLALISSGKQYTSAATIVDQARIILEELNKEENL